MVHVLGLVGGLLYGLHAGVRAGAARAADRRRASSPRSPPARAPTTVLGVPFHIELLASVAQPPPAAAAGRHDHRRRAGPARGARAPSATATASASGTMYGMTEVGVIATDLYGGTGRHPLRRPASPSARSTANCWSRRAASPYLGLSDPTRWSDGWLHTRDAGTLDPATGLVSIRGRLTRRSPSAASRSTSPRSSRRWPRCPRSPRWSCSTTTGSRPTCPWSRARTAGGGRGRDRRELAAYKRPAAAAGAGRRCPVPPPASWSATWRLLRRAAEESEHKEARPDPAGTADDQ